jgi:hypothetical protein
MFSRLLASEILTGMIAKGDGRDLILGISLSKRDGVNMEDKRELMSAVLARLAEIKLV